MMPYLATIVVDQLGRALDGPSEWAGLPWQAVSRH
jgi:hypothetical protein